MRHYSLEAASELTGLSEGVLESWGERFSFLRPAAGAHGQWLYTGEDVQRIRWLADKVRADGGGAEAERRMGERLDRVAEAAREAERRGSILILVAERDPITGELEEYFLKEAGYDVHVVLDGRKAVETAKDLSPDLIILDVILPGLNGLRVCQLLRKEPETKDIPILVFSALDVEERAMAAGASAFLLKPMQQTLLIDAVKTLLARRGEQS